MTTTLTSRPSIPLARSWAGTSSPASSVTGAKVADEEGGARHRPAPAAREQPPQQLQRDQPPAGALHHRRRPGDVAGDERLDRDGRPGAAAGERLVQGFWLGVDLHAGQRSGAPLRISWP